MIDNEIRNYSELNLPDNYEADEGLDLHEDIYLPLLCHSLQHDRFTYGFSAAVLASLAEGLEGLIVNGGKMRLIIGQILTEDEDTAIEQGLDDLNKGHEHFCMAELYKLISENKSHDQKYALNLLSSLIGAGKLEIKFAFKLVPSTRPFQHSKMAIFKGVDDETVCWQGSNNWSKSAAFEHYDSFSLYHSFNPEGGYEVHGKFIQEAFQKFWSGNKQKWDVVTVPDEFYKTWKKAFKKENDLDIKKAYEAMKKRIQEKKETYEPDKLRSYQENAIEKWWKKGKKGILDHATGSGKTYTAVRAIQSMRGSIGQLNVVISVPFIPLADQWSDVLNDYFNNIKRDKDFTFNGVIGCYSGEGNWKSKVLKESNNFNESVLNKKGHLTIIVVVNKTYVTDTFQDIFKNNEVIKQDRLMFVGDECHNFASESLLKNLNEKINYRLGLSATAFNDEQNKTKNEKEMEAYFGAIFDTYTLKNGIDDGYLCNYYYRPIPCFLSEDEFLDWKEYVGNYNPPSDNELQDESNISDIESIIDNSKEKYVQYSKLIKDKQINRKHTITFVGQGKVDEERSIDYVSDKLTQNDWTFQRITYDENKNHRKNTIEGFGRGDIESICAIRVLDEGIDIPCIKTAIILASSDKRRQFIQRRGRVLRSHESKEFAEIYDFIILPPATFSESGKDLILREMKRVKEMGKDALNIDEIKRFVDKYEKLYDAV